MITVGEKRGGSAVGERDGLRGEITVGEERGEITVGEERGEITVGEERGESIVGF